MKPTREIVIWCAALVIAGEATRELMTLEVAGERNTPHAPAMLTAPQPMSTDSLATLGNQVSEGDVFRVARHASNAAYDGRVGGAPGPMPQFMPPVPMKVPLTLRAIIGGPPWQGVIDGFPGHVEGTIVRPGDKIDRFSVRTIGKDTVIIQAPDTTYRLTLKSEW